MCPHVVVKGGGGAGGGGGGRGAGSGGGGSGGGPGGGGDGAGDGSPGAASGSPDGNAYKQQATAGEPIDVATGRVFTLPQLDLALPGPMPLLFRRTYSSQFRLRDLGLGPGWTHTLAWRLERRGEAIRVWCPAGVWVEMAAPSKGEEVVGPFGWSVALRERGFVLDVNDGRRHVFERDSARNELRLVSIEDRCGHRILLKYDGERLIEIVDAVGRRIRFRYDSGGRAVSLEVMTGDASAPWLAMVRYEHDAAGDLVRATTPDGAVHVYSYDARHQLVSHRDAAGLTFHYRYDRQGRGVESWGDYPGGADPAISARAATLLADGETKVRGVHHVKVAYYADGYREVVDTHEVKRFFTTELGLVDRVADGGGVLTVSYDDRGFRTSETDALGATSTYERDARGRILKHVDPLGRVTRLERDDAGDVVRIVDAAGGERTIERDRRGLVTRSVNQVGGICVLVYDDRGLLVELHGPDGHVTSFAYDAHGNTIAKTGPHGGTTRWTYDYLGRVLSETAPDGATRTYEYNPRGLPAIEHLPDGSARRFEYDGEGRLAARVDPDGATWRWEYGGMGYPWRRIDPAGREVRLRFGWDGELHEAIDEAGKVHTFEYDGRRNLVAETTPDGRRTRYRRDARGQIVQMDRAGRLMNLGYDVAQQLTSKDYHDGTSEQFRYDACGKLVEARGPGGAVVLERDPLGRVIAERHHLEGDVVEVATELTPAGRRVATRGSWGLAVSHRREGATLHTSLGADVVEHELDVAGREVERRLPRGGVIAQQVDALGRLRSTEVRSPAGIVARHEYAYDAAGRLASSRGTPSGERHFHYDPAGRLIEAGRETFRYDAAGNLVGIEGTDARWSYRGDVILTAPGVRYRHDDAGQLVEVVRGGGEDEEHWRYTWTAKGTLASAVSSRGRRVTFRYDPFDRRVEKRVFAGAKGDVLERVVRYAWDCDDLVFEASNDPRGRTERSYAYATEHVPLAQHDEATGWSYFVTDDIGTAEMLVGATGRVVAQLPRRAFGRTLVEGDLIATQIRAQGQYEDVETGLHYNRHRYYDPDVGRFISADPNGLRGGLNLYGRGCDPNADIDVRGLARRPGVPVSSLAADDPVRQCYEESIAKSGYSQGSGSCARLANDFGNRYDAKTGRDHGISKTLNMENKGGDGKLGTHEDLNQNWDYHAATELPDGRVVDVDRGRVYANRDEWSQDTVRDPSTVNITPPREPPQAEKPPADYKPPWHREFPEDE